MANNVKQPSVLHPGSQYVMLQEDVAGAQSFDLAFINQADSILLTLFVNSSAGDVNVQLFGITQGGPADSSTPHEVQILSFPTVTGPTTTLLIQIASVTTHRLRLKASTTAAANFEVQARAINGGASTTRVVTSSSIRTDQKNVNTGVPQEIISASLTDQIGFMIRNWSSNSANIFWSTDISKATPTEGYPLAPGDVASISVRGGQAVYASSDVDGADLRMVEGDE